MPIALRPIQVYLDSSDYSRFSQEQVMCREPRLRVTLNRLEQLLLEEKIIIRYSAFHVIEATHINVSAKPAAISRAQLIVRLCGQHCLRWSLELPIYDLFHNILVSRGKKNHLPFPEYAFLDDGHWYPDISNAALDFRNEIRRNLIDMLKSTGLPRHERLKLERQLHTKGKLSPQFRTLLLGSRAQSLVIDPSEFPLSDRFYECDYPMKFIFGDIDANEFAAELMRGAFDPINLIKIYFDQFDHDRHTTNWLRELGNSLISTILGSRGQMSFLRDLAPLLNKTTKDIRHELVTTFDGLAQELRIKHLKELVQDWTEGFDRYGVSKKRLLEFAERNPEASQSFNALVGAYIQYFIDSLDKFENAPHLEASAVGDIHHAMYLPYVDVFRADRYFADVLGKARMPFKTKVVSNLMQLPTVLDEMLEERQLQT